MSDESPQKVPPPGAIHDLAERAVELVRRAVSGPKGPMVLDYRPETLPILDHYLGEVPRDQPETVALIAAVAGAYFGEVTRRVLGGGWEQTSEPPESWILELPHGVRVCPGELATCAITHEEEAGYDVPAPVRPLVEEALSEREVTEEEYFSLSGRLETLQLIADLVAAAAQKEEEANRPADPADPADPVDDGEDDPEPA
jgi:hypothetical protein